MDIFDRLQNSSEPSDRDGNGLKASYLLDLPPDQRRVMRVLLRHTELTYADLSQALEALPEADRLTTEALDKVLVILTEQTWAIRSEIDQTVYYKANFHRRTESAAEKAAPRRRVSPTARGIWDSLESGDIKPADTSANKKG